MCTKIFIFTSFNANRTYVKTIFKNVSRVYTKIWQLKICLNEKTGICQEVYQVISEGHYPLDRVKISQFATSNNNYSTFKASKIPR